MGAIRRNDETRASARVTHPVSSKVNGKKALYLSVNVFINNINLYSAIQLTFHGALQLLCS